MIVAPLQFNFMLISAANSTFRRTILYDSIAVPTAQISYPADGRHQIDFFPEILLPWFDRAFDFIFFPNLSFWLNQPHFTTIPSFGYKQLFVLWYSIIPGTIHLIPIFPIIPIFPTIIILSMNKSFVTHDSHNSHNFTLLYLFQ